MEKIYEEIQFALGSDIKDAVLKLITFAGQGRLAYGKFNGVKLYSDTVSLDSAFMEILGKNYFEFLEDEKATRQKIQEREEEFENNVDILAEEYFKAGEKILDDKYLSEWKRIVPIRLKHIYRGMELRDSLAIISKLNGGCSVQEAKLIIDNQDHSGMSYSLVRLLVKSFCDRGEDFYTYTD